MKITKEDLPEFTKQKLAALLAEPGSILYSSHETLQPGDVYLLGFNPGGENGQPLINSIESMLSREDNAYLDECWANRVSSWNEGEAPLQQRVVWLLETLGLNPRDVCATNLIFTQSRSAKDISYEFAKQCWPVHEAILSIIQPKVIITFGNSDVSPYSYLHTILDGTEEFSPSGHGNWSLKGFATNLNGKNIYVAGLPHLSRYDPRGKQHIADWLSSKVRI
ncbi:MAG: hypothetical protein ACXW11_03885 [Methylotenera sp.]